MRKLIVTMFVSLDGVTEAPHEWSMGFWSDDIGTFKHDELFAVDTLLLGRLTYDGFAAAWPTRTNDDYADRINGMRKVVVSSTLTHPTWNNSVVLADNVAAGVAALKQEARQDLLVFGSMTLVRTLIEHDLVDEYRLLVYPVVLGAGKRLFQDGTSAKLALTGSKEVGSGVVLLTYAPARG